MNAHFGLSLGLFFSNILTFCSSRSFDETLGCFAVQDMLLIKENNSILNIVSDQCHDCEKGSIKRILCFMKFVIF